MASPDDYDVAAMTLDRAAAEIRQLLGPARVLLDQGVLVGGQLTSAVAAELDAAETVLSRVGEELAALAETCRQRAGAGGLAV